MDDEEATTRVFLGDLTDDLVGKITNVLVTDIISYWKSFYNDNVYPSTFLN